MNTEELSHILQREYSLEDWQSVYAYLFPSGKLFQTPVVLDVPSPLIYKMSQVGFAELNGEKLLLLDVEVNPQVVLERNRVALNNVLARWLTVGAEEAAIGVFHSRHHSSFRFTFVRKSVHFNNDGEIVTEQTNARRYTYILGPEKHCRTAIQRFDKLHNTANVSLDDVEEAFSVEALTKQFYHELFDWFQWACAEETGVYFPNLDSAEDKKQALQEHLIRLITRLIFVWFIKQKHLVPDELFNVDEISRKLKDFDSASKTQNNYYRAYLQNLFFATLNREISERAFAQTVYPATKQDHGVTTLYRYADEFTCNEDAVKQMFAQIPYLNGGLFECLDHKTEVPNAPAVYVDGFSRKKSSAARLPNCLFFDDEKGIFPLLERYNFTVEENSAMDQAVALDPELLGKVFENLLGAYNPETQQTARKDSGSFYTPREIVDFMVDESLIAYLKNNSSLDSETLSDLVRNETLPEVLADNSQERERLSKLLLNIRILDPACGSGAFPVGALNRLVTILRKLSGKELDEYQTKMHLIEKCLYGVDIQNIAVQISKLRFFISLICEQTPDLNAPERNFDIAPLPNLETRFVAADTLFKLQKEQTAELFDLTDEKLKGYQDERFAISQTLICPPSRTVKKKLQEREKELAELIRNRLIEISCVPDKEKIAAWQQEILELKTQYQAVEEPKMACFARRQMSLFEDMDSGELMIDINKEKRAKLYTQIHNLNLAISKEQKKASKITEKMETTRRLASWVSSALNSTADFFEPEWMFAIKGGFDIVIGNPPYIQLQDDGGKLGNLYKDEKFQTFEKTGDIYCLFYERGWQLLKDHGHLCFITSNKWMRAGYGKSLRKFLANNTNPELLIDFAGQKIFESATVDTNILLFAKGVKNAGQTKACIAKEGCRENLGDFSQPKIVWSRLMRLAKNDIHSFPRFASVPEGIVTLDSLCFFTGKDIEYLLDTLNSEYASYYFFGSVATLDNGGFQMRQQYVEDILIPPPGNSNLYEKFNFTDDEIAFIKNTVLKRKNEILKDLARNNQT
ncbi:MAG: Eco57I restriction-modification methylase domain-containing protein [Oligosphaeraceae bacterium]